MTPTISTTAQRPRSSARPALFALAAMLVVAASVVGYRISGQQQQATHLLAELRAEEDLRRPLEKLVSIHFGREVPLDEWLAEFQRQTGMKVEVIEHTRLPSVRGGSAPQVRTLLKTTPVQLDLREIPAQEALDALAKLHEVPWKLENGTVVLNHFESDDDPRYVQVYPLPRGHERDQGDALLELIQNATYFDNWNWWGGPWEAEPSPGAITTLQSYRGHWQTRQFLAGLAAAEKRIHDIPTAGLSPDNPVWRPIWFADDAQRFDELQRILDRPVTLIAEEMPLPEFAGELSRQVEFPIVLHPKFRETCEQNRCRVTCGLANTPLRDVFGQADDDEGPTYLVPVAGGRLLAIANHEHELPHPRAAYAVSDLVVPRNPDCGSDELIELLTALVEPDSWQDVGGPGGIDATSGGKLLLISHRLDIHRQIQQLLHALRQVKCRERHSVILGDAALQVDPSARDRYDREIALQYNGLPLREVLTDLRNRWGIDLPDVADAKLLKERVWCHLPPRPLRDNLSCLLREFGCDFDDELGPPRIFVWDSDLPANIQAVFALSPALRNDHNRREVSELITSLVEPDSWGDVGGPGGIYSFGNLLAVSNQPPVVARVQRLLKVLESHRVPGKPLRWRGEILSAEMLNRPLPLDPADDWRIASQMTLQHKLAQSISVSLGGATVGDSLLSLAIQYELPMILNEAEAKGNKLQTLMTLIVDERPLGEVLQLLLGDQQLVGWTTREGVLKIYDAKYQEMLGPPGCLYFVDDLVTPRGKLLPGQLVRTLEAPLNRDKPSQTWAGIDLYFGNFLYAPDYYFSLEESEIIERTLRNLRSGQFQPLPATPHDKTWPYRPFRITGGSLPVVGSLETPGVTR